MALIECNFGSEVLSKNMEMKVILPQERRPDGTGHPTLYLLHGFSDNHTAWTRCTSLERYAEEKKLAVVMPAVDNSYYADMKYGGSYWTFLTEELPKTARSLFPLSAKREDNFVAGQSMGGFGALKWALNHPERFAAAASLSGVTDMVYHLQNVRQENSDKSRYLSLVFGDEDISGTVDDLLYQLRRLDKSVKEKPALYQACGTEDFLYEHNRRFLHACKETSFALTTDFGPGDHEWQYWDQVIQRVLRWLPVK
ncbi:MULTISPECIES: alpha/beta hydrolase family protein [Sediminibacillus]|uniref:alpha/beta hydrolase n=1 Tax=Sediminibacillus TaxID=482460 RepID=UPI0003FB371F|nr:alpha/beta hydrolase family protein [Sediminibacillus terrae]